MLDERDLQMIAKLLGDQKREIVEETSRALADQKKEMMEETSRALADQKKEMMEETSRALADQKKEIMEETSRMFADQKTGIMHEVVALMEVEVRPKFGLLVEKMDLIAEKFLPPEEVEDLDSRVDVLEAVTRRNVREIGRISKELEDLKKAQ